MSSTAPLPAASFAKLPHCERYRVLLTDGLNGAAVAVCGIVKLDRPNSRQEPGTGMPPPDSTFCGKYQTFANWMQQRRRARGGCAAISYAFNEWEKLRARLGGGRVRANNTSWRTRSARAPSAGRAGCS